MRRKGDSLVFADSAIGFLFPLTKNRLGVSPWDKNSEPILVAETKSVLNPSEVRGELQ